MSDNLPPLPKPEYGPTGYAGWLTPYQPSYSMTQMRAYGQQCRAQALEDAEKVCEDIEESAWALWKVTADPHERGRSIGANHCADAIHALKDKP